MKRIALVLIMLIAMFAGLWLALRMQPGEDAPARAVSIEHGVVLSPPRRIAIPSGLVKGDGSAFTMDDLSGHWSLMFYGYTSCPDVCPTAMSVLKTARNLAQGQGSEFPRVFFVSVDPGRDTPELLGEYVRYFDPDFTGVTGDAKMLDALARQMSVAYRRVESPSGNPDEYLMDHSSAILLLDPRGRLAAFLTAPHTPRSVVDSIGTIMSAQQGMR